MEELILVMGEIKDLLSEMNAKLDDIHDEISTISTGGIYTLSNVCNTLDNIENNVANIDTTVSLM